MKDLIFRKGKDGYFAFDRIAGVRYPVITIDKTTDTWGTGDSWWWFKFKGLDGYYMIPKTAVDDFYDDAFKLVGADRCLGDSLIRADK